jgi:hypothetical protein
MNLPSPMFLMNPMSRMCLMFPMFLLWHWCLHQMFRLMQKSHLLLK